MQNYQEELNKIKKILKDNEHGLSVGEISAKIGVNRNSVAKYLDVLQISGYVDLRKIGPAKLFYLTSRVPTFALIDSSAEIIIVLDDTQKIRQLNKPAKKAFGSGANTISNLISDEIFLKSMKKRINSEIKLGKNDYYFKFIECTFDDGAKGLTIIGEDITEKKAYENELILLKHAVEASSSGITIADAKKHDFPLIYVNSGFERITGYKAKDILGKNCRFLQGKDTKQPSLEIVRKALENKTECVVEIKNYTKSGKMFWNELRLSPVKNASGEVTHFVGIQTDITHKKQ